MDEVRKAFQNVRIDIENLQREIEFLKQEIGEMKENLVEICEIIKKISENRASTQQIQKSAPSTHPSTLQHTLEALKPQNMAISTGNQGVPTDRQTDRQTDKYSQFLPEKQENSIDDAAKILDSLDSIKKELRLKFKRLTDQEILVFSILYQLEEETGFTDYKTIAQKLNLTESSIRDYIGRIIKKGIPVEKKRINNKNIRLTLSKNLKKIATLSTILQLRDL
jgi:DNA-binding MarR family transcriptional regulator